MSESPAPQAIDGRGCLYLIILLLTLYLLHGLFILVQASINEAKWREKGSPNYTITVSENSLRRLSGKLSVKDGQVVDAQPKIYSDLKYYQAFTVNSVFERIRVSAFAPFSWETVDYDADYGFPKTVRFNQWTLATDPDGGIDIHDLVLDTNP